LHRRIIQLPVQVEIGLVTDLSTLLTVHLFGPVELRLHLQHVFTSLLLSGQFDDALPQFGDQGVACSDFALTWVRKP
jgi:hypothetical protein